ncbi:MAG TPA: carboxylate-amine ligase [Acidimicrobiia bacterium]|nr:carboxylate-amine ligase [Acidimicrobiia bacterium]
MAVTRPPFTIGIEEEYLLVDRETRELVVHPDPELWEGLREVLGPQVGPEFLKAQIEVGTRKSRTLREAHEDLARLRRDLSDVVSRFGAAILASSTHPFAQWWDQEHTEDARYDRLASDFQQVARRLVICGMHVHVGIDDPDLRIDLMNQVRYFLPHILALSTSSPFWTGRETGLKCYRLSVFQTMPRTGIPEEFSSWSEYERHVAVLVRAGIIEDASKLWWDIRPSDKYPTLEMRAADVCTRLIDAIAVAALYLSLLEMLFRLRTENKRWRTYAPMLISENMWRAQRYGVQGTLMDYGRGELVEFRDLVEELLALTEVDARRLGITEELNHIRTIAKEGTSAQRQLDTYRQALDAGASQREALERVVDMLIDDTLTGL